MAFTVRISGQLEKLVRGAIAHQAQNVEPSQVHRVTLLAFAQTAFYLAAANFSGPEQVEDFKAYGANPDDPSTWDIEMVDDESLN